MLRLGTAGLGRARLGTARPGTARRGKEILAGIGMARLG
jgi:hypothetical protein